MMRPGGWQNKSWPAVAVEAIVAGVCVGLVVIAGHAGRIAYTVTTGHRWRQLKQLGKAI
jgi:hypothetical protein